jgi:F0F1-type ATP synthase membrane subunit a
MTTTDQPDPGGGGLLEFVLTGHHALTVATWALVLATIAMVWVVSVQVRNDPHVPHRIIKAITTVCRWCRQLITRSAE